MSSLPQSSTNTTTRRDERRMAASTVVYNELVAKLEERQKRIQNALEESAKFLGTSGDQIFA